MTEDPISKVAVVGAGSWGTALANLLAEKGLGVDLWVREEEVLRQIKHERSNDIFLRGVELSCELNAVGSYEEALLDKDLVLVVVPSHVFREVLIQIMPFLRPDMALMTATKGIENDTLMTMSQVAQSLLPETYTNAFACLSGPSFAREVCFKHPTAVTVACRDLGLARRLQELFHTDYLRVYTSHDLIGVELGGALKNVIAIAAGASDALHFGHNARAALITRGLAEISRLGVTLGADPVTFAGLAGLGDLVLTCTGDLSRNRMVGLQIGKGMTLREITSKMNMVAEGVKTSKSAYELAKKLGVDMPITTQVYKILYEGKDPRSAVKELMTRELKVEVEDWHKLNRAYQ